MTDIEEGGVRAVTLGAWLADVAAHGWQDPQVWVTIQEAARTALPAVWNQLRPREGEELVSDVVLLARTVPDSWRRLDRAGVELPRWLGGVMKMLVRARRRAEVPTAGGRLSLLVDRPAASRAEAPPPEADARARIDPSLLLTPRQAAAYELACRGLTAQAAADELGISRDAFRDRLRRAKRRLRSGIAAPVRHAMRETAVLARHLAANGHARNAALLVLRSIGTSYRECAASLRMTVEAVRSAIARLWRVWRPSLGSGARDTDLPPTPLPAEGSNSRFPWGGLADGKPVRAVARRGTVHTGAALGGRDPP